MSYFHQTLMRQISDASEGTADRLPVSLSWMGPNVILSLLDFGDGDYSSRGTCLGRFAPHNLLKQCPDTQIAHCRCSAATARPGASWRSQCQKGWTSGRPAFATGGPSSRASCAPFAYPSSARSCRSALHAEPASPCGGPLSGQSGGRRADDLSVACPRPHTP